MNGTAQSPQNIQTVSCFTPSVLQYQRCYKSNCICDVHTGDWQLPQERLVPSRNPVVKIRQGCDGECEDTIKLTHPT